MTASRGNRRSQHRQGHRVRQRVRAELVYPGPGCQRHAFALHQHELLRKFMRLRRHAATSVQIFALWIGSADHVRVRYHAERLTDITGIGTAGSKDQSHDEQCRSGIGLCRLYGNGDSSTEAPTISPGIRWEQVNQSRETMNAVPPAEGISGLQDDARTDLRDRRYQLTPDKACCLAMFIRPSVRRPSPMRSIRRAAPPRIFRRTRVEFRCRNPVHPGARCECRSRVVVSHRIQ